MHWECVPTCWTHPHPLCIGRVYLPAGPTPAPYGLGVSPYLLDPSPPPVHWECVPTCWTHPPPPMHWECLPTCWTHPRPLCTGSVSLPAGLIPRPLCIGSVSLPAGPTPAPCGLGVSPYLLDPSPPPVQWECLPTCWTHPRSLCIGSVSLPAGPTPAPCGLGVSPHLLDPSPAPCALGVSPYLLDPSLPPVHWECVPTCWTLMFLRPLTCRSLGSYLSLSTFLKPLSTPPARYLEEVTKCKTCVGLPPSRCSPTVLTRCLSWGTEI